MAMTTLGPDLGEVLRHRPDTAWVTDGLALFGWGVAERFRPGAGSDRYERAWDLISGRPDAVAFCSLTFDEDDPESIVLVPETTLRIDAEGPRFVTGSADALPEPREPSPMPSGRVEPADAGAWRRDVDAALRAIERGEVEKVVISRSVAAEFDGPVPLHRLLGNLIEDQPASQTFLVDGLIGSSPELLVRLDHGVLNSLSLAGSVDRSEGSDRDLASVKMTREHSLAADSVEGALAPFCSRLARRDREVATFGDIQHLATAFSGQALPGTTIMELIASLHPTGAVAGSPAKAAVELIREIESHRRGRYAGPVGWFDGHGDGEMAIALRCGEVSSDQVTLYAGAGLLEGSEPRAEREETDLKLRPMLRALGLNVPG